MMNYFPAKINSRMPWSHWNKFEEKERPNWTNYSNPYSLHTHFNLYVLGRFGKDDALHCEKRIMSDDSSNNAFFCVEPNAFNNGHASRNIIQSVTLNFEQPIYSKRQCVLLPPKSKPEIKLTRQRLCSRPVFPLLMYRPVHSDQQMPYYGFSKTDKLITSSDDNSENVHYAQSNLMTPTANNDNVQSERHFQRHSTTKTKTPSVKGILKSSSNSTYSSLSNGDGRERKSSSDSHQSSESVESKTSKKKVQFRDNVTSKIILPSDTYWSYDRVYHNMNSYDHNNKQHTANCSYHYAIPRSKSISVVEGTTEPKPLKHFKNLPEYKRFSPDDKVTSFLGENPKSDDVYCKENHQSEITCPIDCVIISDGIKHGLSPDEEHRSTVKYETKDNNSSVEENRTFNVHDKNIVYSVPITTSKPIKQCDEKKSHFRECPLDQNNKCRHYCKDEVELSDGGVPVTISPSSTDGYFKNSKCSAKSARMKTNNRSIFRQVPSLSSEEKTLRILDWLENVSGQALSSHSVPQQNPRRHSYIGE